MKTLADVADFLSGGTPNKGEDRFWNGHIPWYSASNMDRRFLSKGEPRITNEGLNAGSRLAPKGATLLLVRGSGLFKHIPICYADEPVAFNQDVKAICAKPHADPLFLHFWIEGQRQKLEENIGFTGIGAGKFDTDFLKKIPFPDMPMVQQREVGIYAASFDRKIELNRRMNETLEAMARAIFRDWFVTFGPTRAKMAQRGEVPSNSKAGGEDPQMENIACAPYLAPDIWSLFPDRLDADGKPEGWETKPLDQIAEFLNGIALQKYPARGNAFLPVIKIAQLRAGSSDSSDKASPDIPASYVVENGDVLFSWSGSLLQRVWTAGRGALNQHLFKVTSRQYPKWFFFRWIEHHMPDFQATAASKATTMGHIQRHHLTQAMTVVADQAVMNAANEIIAPLFDRGIANDIESRTLAATRDLLLPKLMSGEVRVKDVEKIAGEAA